jgi:hypothetical protein
MLLLAGPYVFPAALAQFSKITKIILCMGVVAGGLAFCLRDLRATGREAAAE